MRQLRYAGPGEDAAHVVVEAVDGGDRFTLVLDDALRVAARQELPKLGREDDAPAPLSPRDIQTRVRAGASPEAVAEEADLPLDKVMRFAFPVLQERIRVADEARRARARRTGPTGEMAVFGELVDGRLAVHGIDPADVAWDSFRRLDGQWTVTAGWRDTDTDRFAQWNFILASRVITPLDETAGDLLSDRPLRPVGLEDEVEDVATVGGVYEDTVPADPAHPTGPIPGGLRLAPAPAPDLDPAHEAERVEVTAPAPAAVERPDPFRGADWPADPAPRGLGSFFERASQSTAPAAPREPAPVAAAPTPVDPAEPLLPFAFDTPDANAPTGRRFRGRHEHVTDDAPALDDAADSKAARARIPSWDDILLGVRRRTD